MSGRGNGRGNISMTQAELTDLINTRVAEDLAAYQAGQQVQPQPNQPACTFKMFMDCKPQTFTGTEGAVGLLRWFEKAESVFAICNCPAGDRVKYAAGTLADGALTWWNAQVQLLGIEAANATTWDDFKELIREEYCPRDEIQKLENEYYDLKMVGSEIEAYVKRSYELADMCPNLSRPMSRRIELFVKGLPSRVKSLVTAAHLNDLTQIVRLPHKIVDQEVESNSLPPRVSATTTAPTATASANDNKRKWDDYDKASSAGQTQKRPDNSSNRSSSQSFPVNQGQGSSQSQGSYAGKKPRCNKCGYHHFGQCGRTCNRCGKAGHEAKDCRAPQPRHQQQQNQLNQNQDNNNQGNGNNNGGNNDDNGARGRVFVIGQGEFLPDDFCVTVLFYSGADTSFVSLKVSQMLNRTPTLLNTEHIVELANGKSLKATHIV
ncbi:putative transcription factor interactor and regulator CCHC(Zn) family [Helianthus annuus]|nr:putative transcription factor interactor and regulator CCHC(Zn) family [Helianthus annuus]KAJ0531561.1 putative transcription factor interactor and regulator CCHC(Zn) family [Helianthus annuus]KAJ0698400.1 putative transcription factor interactor and regulator CCHC(Zn) family [Helianthus annuus]